MKFLVTELALFAPDVDCETGEVGDAEAECLGVHICQDTRQVAKKIQKIEERGNDWSLFEVVGQETRKRALIKKMDGRCLYDVEVV